MLNRLNSNRRLSALLAAAGLFSLSAMAAESSQKACSLVEDIIRTPACPLTECRRGGLTKVTLDPDKAAKTLEGDLLLLDHSCAPKTSIQNVVSEQVRALEARGFAVQGTPRIDAKAATALLRKQDQWIELSALVLDGTVNLSARFVQPWAANIKPAPATVSTQTATPVAAPTKLPEMSVVAAGTNAEVILRLQGSNTIGAKLASALAEAFLKSEGARSVRTVAVGDDHYRTEGDGRAIDIEAHGSGTAFTGLAAGKADIGMSSRPIKPEENATLAALGDLTRPASQHVLGLDGVAVIVNPGNPINALSKEDLAKVFSGAINDWSQLSNRSGAIKVFARDDKSGTYDSFKAMVLGSKSLVAGTTRLEDSRELSQRVASDPNAIGFIGLAYVQGAKALAVFDKDTRPLEPTVMTVGTESYVLSRRLYFYTAPNPSNPAITKFVNFALGKAGQDVLTATGFISQTIESQPVEAEPTAPSNYRFYTKTAERLTLDFHFPTAGRKIEDQMVIDLERVTAYLKSARLTAKDVLLLGFADSTGVPDLNYQLSRNRAQVVAGELAKRGFGGVAVLGFGAAMPVATNETEEGRGKNRRVEIWVKKKSVAPTQPTGAVSPAASSGSPN